MSAQDIVLAAAGIGSSGSTGDPYFYDVSLLLTGDGTNGAQNNTFLDSSTNNFTITRNGNTTQGTFSPYGNLWSNYFDGSGDFLGLSGQPISTTTWTIEAWVFLTGASNIVQTLYSQATAGNANRTQVFFYAASGEPVFAIYHGSNASAASTTTVPRNQWNHVVMQCNGSTVTFYINGVAAGSTAYSAPFQATTGVIGRYIAGDDFTGYISNLRITNTNVYSGNFTPSTTPLTAVSGTSLLTCQSNRFIDNSSNNFTITRNGDVKVTKFSPFNPTAPYSAATIGGSGYFNNTSLDVSSNANLPEGNETYTIEAWIYLTTSSVAAAAGMGIAGWGEFVTNKANYFKINNQGNGLVNYWWDNDLSTADIGIRPNQWHHVVAQFDGTTRKIFLDGALKASNTPTGHNVTVTDNLTVGIADAAFQGYITNVRISSAALYSGSSYTVPSAPLLPLASTQFLASFTNAGIPDAAMMNDLETVGNAQVSTSVKKYGTGSLYFDGTGDSLVINVAKNPALQFGTSDFTIEWWQNQSAGIRSFGNLSSSWAANGWVIGQATTTSFQYFVYNYNSSTEMLTGTIAPNVWQHIAIVRNGSTFTLYINGTAASSATFSGSVDNNAASWFVVGSSGTSMSQYITGYFDDIRITKGLARYTANFTPPTAALPTY